MNFTETELREVLGLSEEKAKRLYELLQSSDREHLEELYKKIPTADPRFHDQIHDHELKLWIANYWADGFGVESLIPEPINHPADFVSLCQYVNLGDTYARTLVYHELEQCWLLTSWGDVFEEWEMTKNDGDTEAL